MWSIRICGLYVRNYGKCFTQIVLHSQVSLVFANNNKSL